MKKKKSPQSDKGKGTAKEAPANKAVRKRTSSVPPPETSPEPVFELKVGRLVEVLIENVIPYEKNPRNITTKAIAVVRKSIEDFGYNVPIVVDSNMVVVTGHTRLQACKALGMKKVKVLIADHLTEAQAREYRVSDNRIGELSSWDNELLIPELRAVGAQGEMDAFFAEGELDALTKSLEKADLSAAPPSQGEIDSQAKKRKEHFADKSKEDDKKLVNVVCSCCGETFAVDRKLICKK
jgi:ParB-like chromosome segregation protein Spo0J